MHTRMAPFELYLWIFLIIAQVFAGFFLRKFLRVYVLSEAALGAILLSIAKCWSAHSYFVAYKATIFINELLLLYVIIGFMCTIRDRGLPRRKSTVPLQIAIVVCFALGIRSASSALLLISNPAWKLIFAWDHAFQFAACALIAVLPVYALWVSTTIKRPLLLYLVGFGAHRSVDAGALDFLIKHHSSQLLHAPDLVYIVALGLWIAASRMDDPLKVATTC